MNRYLGLIMLVVTVLLVGCNRQVGDYVAASSISRNGFASLTLELQSSSDIVLEPPAVKQ
jgi:hypothetical protein